MDSARQCNINYLNEVISPQSTVSRRNSVDSLSHGEELDENTQIGEKNTTESSRGRRQVPYSNESASNPSRASHHKQISNSNNTTYVYITQKD